MQYILMNTKMTKAILDGRKTLTRRAITKFYDISLEEPKKYPIAFKDMPKDLEFKNLQGFGNPCPLFYSKGEDKFYCGAEIKYNTGEKIWVREPAKVVETYLYGKYKQQMDIQYFDGEIKTIEIPKRFLKENYRNKLLCSKKYPYWITHKQGIPNGCIREMARVFLIITGIKIERLQEILLPQNHYDGFFKEGIEYDKDFAKDCNNDLYCMNLKVENDFKKLWNKTAPKGYKWEDNPFVYVYEFERIKKAI